MRKEGDADKASHATEAMNNTFFLRALALPAMMERGGYAIDPRTSDDPLLAGIGDVQMQAAALADGVRLQWIQERPYGDQLSYMVVWRPHDGEIITSRERGVRHVCWNEGIAEAGFFGSDDMLFTVDIVPLGKRLYSFELFVLHQKLSIAAATIDAAPGEWFTEDAVRRGEGLRLYEMGSLHGGGLVIDPQRGGPTRVTPATASPRSVQLALMVDDDCANCGLRIVAASTSPEFAGSLCDPHVMLENTLSEPHDMTLGDWYLSHRAFTSNSAPYSTAGSIAMPRHINIAPGTRGGEGFIVCMENDGTRRFARVQVIAAKDGRLLRGDLPDRYVELEISLGHPGVPWA
jgi:hypothetical protein